MSIGANIKKRRYELRMSQQELADALGYRTRSTIAKIESGENDISQKKLQRFAAVLDTTVEQLMSGSLSPRPAAPVPMLSPTNRSKNVAIILAGGKSMRNLQNIPNQFISIQGKPVITYVLEAYESHPAIDDVYIVCLRGWEDIVKAYADQYGITKLRGIIPAGPNGIASVRAGFDFVRDMYAPDDIIIIQESTRPMVTVDMISKLIQTCSEKGNATVCQSMRDYLQFTVDGDRADYVDRNKIVDLQSPEAHRLSSMIDVFTAADFRRHALTETCYTMLMYNLGFPINLVEGSVNNIKIVRQEDVAIFSSLIRQY